MIEESSETNGRSWRHEQHYPKKYAKSGNYRSTLLFNKITQAWEKKGNPCDTRKWEADENIKYPDSKMKIAKGKVASWKS